MSELERFILHKTMHIYKETKQPVRTLTLSCHIPKHERYIREVLRRLEGKGRVARVGGHKGRGSGWLPLPEWKPVPVKKAGEWQYIQWSMW